MKRTKEWWGRLSKCEKKELIYLEKADKKGGYKNDSFPPNMYECPACSQPTTFYNLCIKCWAKHTVLVKRGNGGYYEFFKYNLGEEIK